MYLATQINRIYQPVRDMLVSLKVPIFLCKPIVYYIHLQKKTVKLQIIESRHLYFKKKILKLKILPAIELRDYIKKEQDNDNIANSNKANHVKLPNKCFTILTFFGRASREK
jgi:hypothetical protein